MEKFYFLGFMSYCSHDPSAAMVEVTKSGGGLILSSFILKKEC